MKINIIIFNKEWVKKYYKCVYSEFYINRKNIKMIKLK